MILRRIYGVYDVMHVLKQLRGAKEGLEKLSAEQIDEILKRGFKNIPEQHLSCINDMVSWAGVAPDKSEKYILSVNGRLVCVGLEEEEKVLMIGLRDTPIHRIGFYENEFRISGLGTDLGWKAVDELYFSFSEYMEKFVLDYREKAIAEASRLDSLNRFIKNQRKAGK